MLERIENLPTDVVGVRAKGRVSREDYERVLEPMVHRAAGDGRPLKFLYHLGSDFDGFTPGAALEDARIGLRHMRRFRRCAIVSDHLWVRASSRLAGALLPCPVKVFHDDTVHQAVRWLDESASGQNLRYQVLPDAKVLLLEPTGELGAEDFDSVEAIVDPWIEEHGGPTGLVVRMWELLGWDDLWGFLEQMSLVREHSGQVDRVAVASDVEFADMSQKPASLFAEAEFAHFGYDEVEAAVSWAQGRVV
jgi:hypothetical protein